MRRVVGAFALFCSLVAVLVAPTPTAAEGGCVSGFGIDGVIQADGNPISGASVDVRIFASNYVGPFSLDKVAESSTITSAADGSYEFCSLPSLASFDVPGTAQVVVSLAITPPTDLYGIDAGQFGVTLHRSVLGTLSELTDQPHEVNGELLAATATGQVSSQNGAELSGTSVRFVHRAYPSVIDINIPARNDGWFGFASNNPQRFSEMSIDERCWECYGTYEVVVTADGMTVSDSQVVLADIEPYAVWVKNLWESGHQVSDASSYREFELREANLQLEVVDRASQDVIPTRWNASLQNCSGGYETCYSYSESSSEVVKINLSRNGRWSLYLNPSISGYSQTILSVVVSDGAVTAVTTTAGDVICEQSCDELLTVEIEPPNFEFAIRAEDSGAPIPNLNINASLVDCPDGAALVCWSHGFTDQGGAALMSFPTDGMWRVSSWSEGNSTGGYANFNVTVTVSAGVVTSVSAIDGTAVCDGNCDGAATIELDPPNMRFDVVASDTGERLLWSWVHAHLADGCPEMANCAGGGPLTEAGSVPISFNLDGTWTVNVTAEYGSGYSNETLSVVVSGGVVSSVTTSAGVALCDGDCAGAVTVPLDPPNMRFTVVASDTNEGLQNATIHGSLEPCEEESCFAYGNTNSSGEAGLSFSVDGTWRVGVNAPYQSGYSNVVLLVVVDGGVVSSVTTSAGVVLCDGDCAGAVTVPLDPPNMRFTVVASDTNEGLQNATIVGWLNDCMGGCQDARGNTNSSGEAGLSFSVDGTWRTNVNAPYQSGYSNVVLLVVVDGGVVSSVTTSAGVVLCDGDCAGAVTVPLDPPNMRFTVVASDTSEPLRDANISSWLNNCMGDCQNAWGNTNSNGEAGLSFSVDGTWRTNVNAPYQSGYSNVVLLVVVDGGVVSSVTTSDGVVLCDGDCAGAVTVPLDPPNFAAIVRSASGDAVEGASIDISKWTLHSSEVEYENDWWSWEQSDWVESAWSYDWSDVEAGTFETSLFDGIYRFVLRPPWNGGQDVARTVLIAQAQFDAAGQLTGLQRCEPGEHEWAEPTCSGTGESIAFEVVNGSSYFVLQMREPNLRVSVCASGSADCVPVATHVQLMKYVVDEWSDYGWWNHLNGNSSNENGEINFVLDESGDYRFVLEPNSWGGSEDEARTTIDFSVVVSGETLTINGLGAVNSTSGRYELFFAEPTFTARVVSPDDRNPQRWTSIAIFQPMEDCASCRQHIGWLNTNQNGEAGVVLPEGDYTLRLNPSGDATQLGLARTEIDISILDCDDNGVLEVYLTSDQCGAPLADETGIVEFALAGMNFTGTLYASTDESEVVQWASGQVRVQAIDEWSGQSYWEWTDNWFEVRNGDFGIALTRPGRYQIRFEPNSYGYSQGPGLATSIEVEVVCDGPCEVNPLTELATNEAGYIIHLAQPNVTGTLNYPDRDEGVSGSWVNVEKWSFDHCWEGCYSWDNSLDGTNASTRNDGSFGVLLASGSYRLTFNEVEGYSRSQLQVLVDANGTVCAQPLDADGLPDTTAQCSSSGVPFSVQLTAPNVQGTVMGGTTASRWSGIQVQFWNPEWEGWDWTNQWANTNDNGQFALRIETAGFYKLTFEPQWELIDHSATFDYVVVCGSGPIARVSHVGSVSEGTGWDCPSTYSTMPEAVTLDISLVGANLSGRAVDELGNGVGDVWIGLQECGPDDGTNNRGCYWQRGVNTRRVWGSNGATENGRFGLTILDENPDDEFATRYQLEINPPWDNSQGFVRQRINVYAFSGWESGRSICIGTNYEGSVSPPTCADGALINEATSYSLYMTTGNIKGRVVTNEAACDGNELTADNCPGVRNSWVEVQQWRTPEWNESADWFHWQWTEHGTQTVNGYESPERTGNFSLQLDDGLYRVIANPSWENSGGYARKSVMIRVADGNWCVEPGSGNNFDSENAEPVAEPCTPGANDNVDDSFNGLTMRLVGSNLLGRLYAPGSDLTDETVVADSAKKVGNVWVGLERRETYTWCGDINGETGELEDYCSNSWWSWISGSSAPGSGLSKGNFAMSVSEPGEYRLRVEAPDYRSAGLDEPLTSFNEPFTVSGDGCIEGNEDPSLCEITFTGVHEMDGQRTLISFPSPNVTGTLFSPNAAVDGSQIAVGGAWISIYNETQNEWQNGVTTIRSGTHRGEYSLLLTPPETGEETYRLEFWPNWDRPQDGLRRIVRVTVAADGTVTSDGFNEGTQDVTLLGVTLKGSIYYEVGGEVTPMRYAWAEAERCVGDGENPCDTREWVDGRGSERDGSIQLGLDDGTYWIRVHPNWGLLATSPMEMSVSIAAGRMTDCTYDSGGSCMRESDGEVYFEPNFHHVPPNVRISVGGNVANDRYVNVTSCVDSECLAQEVVGTYLATFDNGEAILDLYLDFSIADHYRVKVLVREGETSNGAVAISAADDDLTSPTAQLVIS